jgi:acyl carrier protein
MLPDEIREILLEVLLDIQERSGRQVPEEIDDGTRPIGDFEGFDSINVAEATSELTKYLDCKFPLNLLFGPSPDKQLTIEEMLSRIQYVMNAEGGLL